MLPAVPPWRVGRSTIVVAVCQRCVQEEEMSVVSKYASWRQAVVVVAGRVEEVGTGDLRGWTGKRKGVNVCFLDKCSWCWCTMSDGRADR